MRALVTGGAGFVGTNLIKRLLKDGHDVTSVDNYSTGFRENQVADCTYITLDVTESFDNWDVKFDVIFHLAALARIQPSIKEPLPSIKANFNGTLNILEYARKYDIPVVYAGSSSYHHGLYGSPYAWSKYGGEELCKLYGEVYDVTSCICRFYNVYGDHMITEGEYATVVAIFQRQYLAGESLTITADGAQRRDFTHVDDIVDGLVSCMRAMHGEVDMRFSGEIFELGSGKNHSIREVAKMFNTSYKFIPARPGEYDKTLCDYSKAEEILGYKPTGDLEEYITNWLSEQQKHPWDGEKGYDK